jgi:hypothetical protein
MIKKTLFPVFLCCTFIALGQTKSKKEILLDENDYLITVQEFQQKIASPNYKYTYAIFENDTAIFAKALLRREEGRLSPEFRSEILAELRKITGR